MIKRTHFLLYGMLFCMFLGLSAQPALAFTLDIWGVAHVSADAADNGQTDSTYIASNSSRLGFSGDHDLGNGLSAIYRYEAGVDLTGQSGNDGNGGGPRTGELFTNTRDSFVGLAGGFGKLQFGRMGGLNEWLYDFNLFGDQVGDLGNIWGGTGLAGRVSSMARYTTPDIGGFNASLSYAPEEGDDNETDITLIKANFGIEGLKLGAAYMSQGTGVDLGTGKALDEHTATAITASYNFGNFTIGGGWQDESDIGGTKKNDRDGFNVGASAALGDATVKAQYTSTSGDLFKETDATQIAVGVDYSLGKNTTIYIAYATTDNDDFNVGSPGPLGFGANNYGHGDSVGAAADLSGKMGDPDAISIGLVYKFNAGLWPR